MQNNWVINIGSLEGKSITTDGIEFEILYGLNKTFLK